MKKIILLAALPAALFISSCKKDKKETTTTNGGGFVPQQTSITAKVDGVTLTGNIASSSSSGLSTLYLSNPSSGQTVYVYLNHNIAPGTYNISGTGYPGLSYSEGSQFFQTYSGEIVVNQNDTVNDQMKGTFSGTLIDGGSGDQRSITGGTFTLNYN